MPTWVRCRDPKTRHEFDLHENDVRVRDGRVEVLDSYPDNTGTTARPRQAKHRTTKAVRPSKQAATSADETGSE